MNVSQRTVSQVMQRDVVTLKVADHLDIADDIMRLGRVRHLPVVDGDRLVGVLSNRDLLAASLTKALDFEPAHRRAFMRAVEVREVMTKDPLTVSPGSALERAARLMIDEKIGCLPVVDGESRLVGLVTETDLLRAAYCEAGAEDDADVIDVSPAPRDWRERFEAELDELRRVRDELKLQAHLGKADARDVWERLEHRYAELEAQVKHIALRSEAPLHEIGESARKLMDELRNGYRELRRR
jgi:CBS domain-containing protein